MVIFVSSYRIKCRKSNKILGLWKCTWRDDVIIVLPLSTWFLRWYVASCDKPILYTIWFLINYCSLLCIFPLSMRLLTLSVELWYVTADARNWGRSELIYAGCVPVWRQICAKRSMEISKRSDQRSMKNEKRYQHRTFLIWATDLGRYSNMAKAMGNCVISISSHLICSQ